MQIVREPSVIRERSKDFRLDGQTIGLVPTMGALHEGHLSLVRRARETCDRIMVSIFVNPTQFGPNEDYLRYPRNEEQDLEMLRSEDVDIAYLPSVAAMYQTGADITVDPGHLGHIFEGKIRPGHFRGVLTLVAKLFLQINPHSAIFGQKDAQQLFLIRQMVRDLNFPLTIIEAETIREADGLAMSSRNVFLKTAERKKTIALHNALGSAKAAFKTGVRSLVQLQAAMNDVIAEEQEIVADYLTAVSEDTFLEIDPVPDNARLIGAVRLGSVRLIDNLKLSAA